MATSKPRIPPIITPIAESDRNANSIWYRFFDSLLEYIVNGFPDAPDDGNQYGRQSLQWTVINQWVDAPADNLYYGRVNNQWGVVVEEAPRDGSIYARENGDWILVGTGLPAPPNKSIQWNNGGVFGGSLDMTYDQPTNTIYLGDSVAGTIKPVARTADVAGLDVTIEGGAAALTGFGGDVNIFGGAAGTTSGWGGSVNIIAANGVGPGSFPNSVGGYVTITAGNGGNLTGGGAIAITAGAAGAGGGTGGNLVLTGGASTTAGGGEVQITGGASGNTGGRARITGGASSGNPGAGVYITGGAGSGGSEGVTIATSGGYLNITADYGINLGLAYGNTGTSGQVLTSRGIAQPEWKTPTGGTVTSVTVNGTSGRITSSGSPITSSGTITLDLATTAVTPGSYTNTDLTVDAYGRITAASNGAGGGGVSDGDKGDITVSSGGTVWTIDAGAVSYAKMQDVSAASRLLGRGSAGGAGDVEEIALGTGLSMSGTTLNASAPANPMTAAGSIIKGGTAGVQQELVIGTNGHVLTVVSGAPAWAAATVTGQITVSRVTLTTAAQSSTYAGTTSATASNMSDTNGSTGTGTNTGTNEYIEIGWGGTTKTICAVEFGGGSITGFGAIAGYLNGRLCQYWDGAAWVTWFSVSGVADSGSAQFLRQGGTAGPITTTKLRILNGSGYCAATEFVPFEMTIT